jgi:hypothetical protein
MWQLAETDRYSLRHHQHLPFFSAGNFLRAWHDAREIASGARRTPVTATRLLVSKRRSHFRGAAAA